MVGAADWIDDRSCNSGADKEVNVSQYKSLTSGSCSLERFHIRRGELEECVDSLLFAAFAGLYPKDNVINL